LVGQRSRLLLSYNESKFQFKFSAQDARVWGQNENQMLSNTIHIHEAWAVYKPNPSLIIKLGRQELKYDDQRIIAARNFSLTGITYDAGLLVYTNSDRGFTFHWGAMINNPNDARFLTFYTGLFKYVNFLWSEIKIAEGLKVNTLNFFDLTQKPDDPSVMYGRNTIGANLITNPSAIFGGRIGGYYQFGRSWMDFGGGSQMKIRPNAFSANATVWAKPLDKLKVSANFDMYSGHDWSRNSDRFTAFNRLLAAGHAHLGLMDYFTTVQLNEVRYAGILDYFIAAELFIKQKTNLQLTAHYFTTHKPYIPAQNALGYEEIDRSLGSEIDLVFNHRFTKEFSIQSAWMVMFPTETLERLKGVGAGNSQFSHFGYLSLLFTPNFFEYSKTEPQQN